jgi:hypothetical protein
LSDDIAPKKGKVPELLQKFLILKNQKVSVGDPAVQVDVLLLERKEGGSASTICSTARQSAALSRAGLRSIAA